jgi:hypothetical protein
MRATSEIVTQRSTTIPFAGEVLALLVNRVICGASVVAVAVAVAVAVGVSVDVAVAVSVAVAVVVAVDVTVAVGVREGVLLGVNVAVAVGVGVSVGVNVSVGVAVKVGMGVRVGVWLGVIDGSTISVGISATSSGRHALKSKQTSRINSNLGDMVVLLGQKKMRSLYFSFLIILIFLSTAACQPSPTLPPTFISPSVTPRPAQPLRPTQTPRPVASSTATEFAPRPTPTRWPVTILLTPGEGPPPFTLEPLLLAQVNIVTPAASDAVNRAPIAGLSDAQPRLVVGYSVEGREISARQFGTGNRVVLLVGGMHGGWEANTVALVNELITHFENNPGDVLPGIRLILIPVINPDGLVRGRTPEGRFNTNGVDLNRNWGCDWSPDAFWRDNRVNAGPSSLSEPETQWFAAFVQQTKPVVALFYHSAAGGVYEGACNGDHGSAAMSAVLGEATGYSYGEAFSAYPVSGTAANWADGLGIAAADVELATWTESEFEVNLRGVMAVQRWLLGTAE